MYDRDRNVIRTLAAMAEPSRYRMIQELVGGSLCVTELGRAAGVSQSCATRHLQALERAGIVASRRQGKRVTYYLASEDPFLAGVVRWVTATDSPQDVVPARPSVQALAAQARRGDLEDYLL